MNRNFEYGALGNYKSELFKVIWNSGEKSELLVDLIMPTLDDDRFDKQDNFFGGEFDIVVGGKKEHVKLKGRLYNVPFIYTTITETINVICIDTNVLENSTSTKKMSVTIDLMCHKDNLEITDSKIKAKYRKAGYVGNRLDIATALLGDILNHSKELGNIGELVPRRHNPVSSFFPNKDFFGKVLEYTCSDFMIDYAKRSENNE